MVMKTFKCALALSFALISSVAIAQDQQSLFSKAPKLGFFAGAGLQAGPVAGETAGFASFRTGLMLNENFSIGGTYSFTFNEFTPSAETDSDMYMDLQLGGLALEYTLNPGNLFHFTFPLTLGAGEVQMDWKESAPNYGTDILSEDNFFFVEPGAMAELNLTPGFRLHAGLTYRLIPGGVDYRTYSAADLSGITGSFGLKYVLF
jgi:hypothetical protein